MKKMHLTTHEEHLDLHYGKRGTPKREKYEKGFEKFMLGVMIAQAREEKGLTQAKLAKRSGTDKSYISKLENDLKDIRFSTLQKIIRDGLGARLEISIKF